MEVYKILENPEKGIERLTKEFASVKQLNAELGGTINVILLLSFQTAIRTPRKSHLLKLIKVYQVSQVTISDLISF